MWFSSSIAGYQRNESGVAKVTDPNGVQWTVRRRRWFDMSFLGSSVISGDIFSGNDLGAALLGLVLLPFLIAFLIVAIWPFWFIAHWLGLPWRITIQREGNEVGEEEVRGWYKPGRRIQEIAQSVAAGTPQFREIESSASGSTEPVTDESARKGEPTRCVLYPIAAFGRWDRPMPGLAIDAGKDTIWVIDLNTNALIASDWLAQVTATPAKHHSAGPVLILGVPGLPTLTIRPPNQIQRRPSWRGEVAKTRGPVYLATEDQGWLTLVEKLGLTEYLR
jgi:hypothetical protein